MSYELAQQYCHETARKVRQLFGLEVRFVIVTDLQEGLQKEITLKVIKAVCAVYGEDFRQFEANKKRRTKNMSDMKKTISYLLRVEYGFTYFNIAQLLGMSHPSIMNQVQQYKNHRKFEEDFKARSCEVFELLKLYHYEQ